MNLGQIVHLGNSEDFWIVMEQNWKTCKGIAKAKVFKKLPKKENLFPIFKPYTKERMTKSSKANINKMNEEEAKEYLRLKSLHFIEMKED